MSGGCTRRAHLNSSGNQSQLSRQTAQPRTRNHTNITVSTCLNAGYIEQIWTAIRTQMDSKRQVILGWGSLYFPLKPCMAAFEEMVPSPTDIHPFIIVWSWPCLLLWVCCDPLDHQHVLICEKNRNNLPRSFHVFKLAPFLSKRQQTNNKFISHITVIYKYVRNSIWQLHTYKVHIQCKQLGCKSMCHLPQDKEHVYHVEILLAPHSLALFHSYLSSLSSSAV